MDTITDASIKTTLLQVKFTQSVSLNFKQSFTRMRETTSKGAPFALYNISRLSAIKKKYFLRVEEGTYPKLLPPEEVDFSVLKESEEWTMLFDYLLEYPSLVNKTAEDILKGMPSIHKLCSFLLHLSSLFSIYYRRVRILLVNIFVSTLLYLFWISLQNS